MDIMDSFHCGFAVLRRVSMIFTELPFYLLFCRLGVRRGA